MDASRRKSHDLAKTKNCHKLVAVLYPVTTAAARRTQQASQHSPRWKKQEGLVGRRVVADLWSHCRTFCLMFVPGPKSATKKILILDLVAP